MTESSVNSFQMNDRQREAWWRDWFNHVYLDVYAHRDENDAQIEAGTALSILKIEPEDRILDLCCGNGRHCRALRQAGCKNVTGVDFSFPLLEHAIAESRFPDYVRGDMRFLPFPDSSMDTVLSFFTSFGYFTSNIENLSVLQEIARILHPGGSFMLDYLNPSYVRNNYVPESVKEHGEFKIHEKRSLSPDGGRIEKEIIIKNWGGKDRIYHESVRLYEHEQMREMLQSANLQVQDILGSFDKTPFTEKSPRMILFGNLA